MCGCPPWRRLGISMVPNVGIGSSLGRFDAEHRGFHSLRGVFIQPFDHVGIQVEGNRDLAMAEPLGGYLRVNASGEHERGGEVAKIVDPDRARELGSVER